MKKHEWQAILPDQTTLSTMGAVAGYIFGGSLGNPSLARLGIGLGAVAFPKMVNLIVSSLSSEARVINENNPSESKKSMEEALMTGSLVQYVIAGVDDKNQKQILYLSVENLRTAHRKAITPSIRQWLHQNQIKSYVGGFLSAEDAKKMVADSEPESLRLEDASNPNQEPSNATFNYAQITSALTAVEVSNIVNVVEAIASDLHHELQNLSPLDETQSTSPLITDTGSHKVPTTNDKSNTGSGVPVAVDRIKKQMAEKALQEEQEPQTETPTHQMPSNNSKSNLDLKSLETELEKIPNQWGALNTFQQQLRLKHKNASLEDQGRLTELLTKVNARITDIRNRRASPVPAVSVMKPLADPISADLTAVSNDKSNTGSGVPVGVPVAVDHIKEQMAVKKRQEGQEPQTETPSHQMPSNNTKSNLDLTSLETELRKIPNEIYKLSLFKQQLISKHRSASPEDKERLTEFLKTVDARITGIRDRRKETATKEAVQTASVTPLADPVHEQHKAQEPQVKDAAAAVAATASKEPKVDIASLETRLRQLPNKLSKLKKFKETLIQKQAKQEHASLQDKNRLTTLLDEVDARIINFQAESTPVFHKQAKINPTQNTASPIVTPIHEKKKEPENTQEANPTQSASPPTVVPAPQNGLTEQAKEEISQLIDQFSDRSSPKSAVNSHQFIPVSPFFN
jgi:hypothetical protein